MSNDLGRELRELLDKNPFPLIPVPRAWLEQVLQAFVASPPLPPLRGMPEIVEETQRLRALGECPNCGELPHFGVCP